MKRVGALRAVRTRNAALAALSGVLLASCSSTSDPIARLGLVPQADSAVVAQATSGQPADDVEDSGANSLYSFVNEDDPVLPDAVAQVPTLQSAPTQVAALETEQPATTQPTQQQIQTVVETRIGPAGPEIEAQPMAVSATPAPQPPQPARKRGFFASLFGSGGQQTASEAAKSEPAAPPAAAKPAATPEPADQQVASAAQPIDAGAAAYAPAEPARIAQNAAAATTYVENRPPEAEPVSFAEPKKRGFFSSLFSPAEAAPAPQSRAAVQPILQLASAAPVEASAEPRAFIANDALPGVHADSLFEISRKSGTGDDSDIDINEGEDGGVQLASAAGLARLAPNGLLTQTDRVDVGCLKPSLVRVLKAVETHYGQRVVVTSGFRSPPANRRARGARNSLHMYCAAADIQVQGVTKWELAQYLRSMPGRGGVGTYCYTNSVHIDVGPERDWNWRCRKRKK